MNPKLLSTGFATVLALASSAFANILTDSQIYTYSIASKAVPQTDNYPFPKMEAEDCYRYRKRIDRPLADTHTDSEFAYACLQPDGRWIFKE